MALGISCILCVDNLNVTELIYRPCACGIDLCTKCLRHLVALANQEDTLEVKCPQCLKWLDGTYFEVRTSDVEKWYYLSLDPPNDNIQVINTQHQEMAISYIIAADAERNQNIRQDTMHWDDQQIIEFLRNARNEELRPVRETLYEFDQERMDVIERVENDELPAVQTQLSSKVPTKVTTGIKTRRASLGLSSSRIYSKERTTQHEPSWRTKSLKRSQTSPITTNSKPISSDVRFYMYKDSTETAQNDEDRNKMRIWPFPGSSITMNSVAFSPSEGLSPISILEKNQQKPATTRSRILIKIEEDDEESISSGSERSSNDEIKDEREDKFEEEEEEENEYREQKNRAGAYISQRNISSTHVTTGAEIEVTSVDLTISPIFSAMANTESSVAGVYEKSILPWSPAHEESVQAPIESSIEVVNQNKDTPAKISPMQGSSKQNSNIDTIPGDCLPKQSEQEIPVQIVPQSLEIINRIDNFNLANNTTHMKESEEIHNLLKDDSNCCHCLIL